MSPTGAPADITHRTDGNVSFPLTTFFNGAGAAKRIVPFTPSSATRRFSADNFPGASTFTFGRPTPTPHAGPYKAKGIYAAAIPSASVIENCF